MVIHLEFMGQAHRSKFQVTDGKLFLSLAKCESKIGKTRYAAMPAKDIK